jgi:tetratricopeptide (TPR) repeat protein
VSIRTGLVCFFAGALIAIAQPQVARHEGKLISEGSPEHLWVEVHDAQAHMMADRVPVNRDGSFVVNVNSSQMYEIRIVTRHGERVTGEFLQFRPGQPLEMRLPKSLTAGPPPAGPISILRLSHKPTKFVKKLASESDSLASNGQLPASVERLEKALEADPNWFEAWNNLGSRRLQMGKHAEAVEAFRRAAAIDPNNALVQSNLGLALLFTRDAAGAEEAARKSLLIEPDGPRAKYVKGMALLQQHKRPEEGLESLRASSKVMPRALLATAEWSCRHNDFAGCETDLRAFLRTPKGPNHEAAEKWLSEVKKARKTNLP